MNNEVTSDQIAEATQAFLANGGQITILPEKDSKQSNRREFPVRKSVRVKSMHKLSPEELISRIL